MLLTLLIFAKYSQYDSYCSICISAAINSFNPLHTFMTVIKEFMVAWWKDPQPTTNVKTFAAVKKWIPAIIILIFKKEMQGSSMLGAT